MVEKIYTTVLEVLIKEDRWTQRCSSRNEEGEEVLTHDKSATCWCLLGALHLVYGESTSPFFCDDEISYKSLSKAIEEYVGKPIRVDKFNDSYKHSDIVKALEMAGV